MFPLGSKVLAEARGFEPAEEINGKDTVLRAATKTGIAAINVIAYSHQRRVWLQSHANLVNAHILPCDAASTSKSHNSNIAPSHDAMHVTIVIPTVTSLTKNRTLSIKTFPTWTQYDS